jgi:hypothetical protein
MTAQIIPLTPRTLPDSYRHNVSAMLDDAYTLYTANRGTNLENGWRNVYYALLDVYKECMAAERQVSA